MGEDDRALVIDIAHGQNACAGDESRVSCRGIGRGSQDVSSVRIGDQDGDGTGGREVGGWSPRRRHQG